MGNKKAEDRSDSKDDAQGLIRMLAHGLISGFGALDRLVANTARGFLSAFHFLDNTMAGFPEFLCCHIGGGSYQGARIFGKRAHVVLLTCLYLSFIHIRYFRLGLD